MKKIKTLFKRYWAIVIFLLLIIIAVLVPSTILSIAPIAWSMGAVAPKEQKEYSKAKAAREAEKRGLITTKNQYP